MECLNKKKIEKVKGSNIVNCVQNKYFCYIIDEIVSLSRSFQKLWLSSSSFITVFVIPFINSIYQLCIPSWRFSKWVVSLLYRINIWKFGISMANLKQIVWEPMKYRIIFLITPHEQSSCTLSKEKQNVHVFIQVAEQKKCKNI